MGHLELPDWVTRTVMLMMGIDPDEEDEEEETDEAQGANDQQTLTVNQTAAGVGMGVAGATAVGASGGVNAALSTGDDPGGDVDPENAAPAEPKKRNWFNQVDFGQKFIMMSRADKCTCLQIRTCMYMCMWMQICGCRYAHMPTYSCLISTYRMSGNSCYEAGDDLPNAPPSTCM